MTELTLASFNTHYGMRPGRTPGRPFDVTAALRSLDAEVLAIQEVWRPDGEAGVVDVAAAELGYTVHHLELGRATVSGRWPHADPDGEGTIGIAVLTRGVARIVGPIVVGPTLGDPITDRAVLHSELALGEDATPLQLVVVHLSSRLPTRRRSSSPGWLAPCRHPACPRWSRATATSGDPVCARSSGVGRVRCAVGRGPQPVRTARSITCSCVPTTSRSSRDASSPTSDRITDPCGWCCGRDVEAVCRSSARR